MELPTIVARGALVRCGVVVAAILALAAMSGVASSEAMLTGGLTSQPIGHYEFCRANSAECMIRSRDQGPEHMTGRLWKQIISVNASVNGSIRPMNDFDVWGKDEVWSYPDGVGDCEDYVLEKRRELHEKGLSFSNLLITVVKKPDDEGHAVLTIRTDKGDFILDNLTDEVKVWSRTGYRFLKRQASNHTGRWVKLLDDRNTLVGSVQ